MRVEAACRFAEGNQLVWVNCPEGGGPKDEEKYSHDDLVARAEYLLEGCSIVNDPSIEQDSDSVDTNVDNENIEVSG